MNYDTDDLVLKMRETWPQSARFGVITTEQRSVINLAAGAIDDLVRMNKRQKWWLMACGFSFFGLVVWVALA